ncbi:MAG: hypothetical protein O3A81_03440 [bacterium]|nr:hypothetical protein [bacterium]
MGIIFEFLIGMFLDVIFYFLLIPISWIVSTPWILIKSFWGNGTYWINLQKNYSIITHLWLNRIK